MKNNYVYEYINITNIINQLNIKKVSIIGNYIHAICPFCQDETETNGYMKINTINNLYICNNCGSTGTSIDLYANVKHISTKDAFKKLLEKTPVLERMPYIFNNTIKDESYRDLVYSKFLELQSLTEKHQQKLKSMNFVEEYITKNKFKSIETNPRKKKEICEKLQEQGLKLSGVSRIFSRYRFQMDI